MSLKDILDMGEYGVYVWSCYGLTLAVLVLNVWLARRSLAEQQLHAKRRSQMNSESSS
jgi:heme exporter protein CcmD